MKSVGNVFFADHSRSRDELHCMSERRITCQKNAKKQKKILGNNKIVYECMRGGNGNKLLIYFYGSLMSRILLFFLYFIIFYWDFQGCPIFFHLRARTMCDLNFVCTNFYCNSFIFLRKRHCRMAKQTNQMFLPVFHTKKKYLNK